MMAGYLFFEIIITRKFTNFCIIVLILAVLQIFYNEDAFTYFLGENKQKYVNFAKQNDHPFKEVELNFPFDYDRQNPITQRQSYSVFLKKMFKKKKIHIPENMIKDASQSGQ